MASSSDEPRHQKWANAIMPKLDANATEFSLANLLKTDYRIPKRTPESDGEAAAIAATIQSSQFLHKYIVHQFGELEETIPHAKPEVLKSMVKGMATLQGRERVAGAKTPPEQTTFGQVRAEKITVALTHPRLFQLRAQTIPVAGSSKLCAGQGA